jgi:hypothetical protein
VLLIKRLLHGQPTYFQTLGGSVYYISTKVLHVVKPDAEIRIVDDLLDPVDVVALVDADGRLGVHTPCNILLSSPNIRIIVASSPRERESQKWLKQLNVPDGQRARMIDIWSEAELFITA